MRLEDLQLWVWSYNIQMFSPQRMFDDGHNKRGQRSLLKVSYEIMITSVFHHQEKKHDSIGGDGVET